LFASGHQTIVSITVVGLGRARVSKLLELPSPTHRRALASFDVAEKDDALIFRRLKDSALFLNIQVLIPNSFSLQPALHYKTLFHGMAPSPFIWHYC